MAKRDQEEGIVSRMPGTGGDYIDTQDVEGHRANRTPGAEDLRRDSELEGEGLRRDSDDVEGHRFIATPFQGGESELFRRVPGDNPHGDH